MIKNAAQVIGKSDDRLKVFEAIYFGKTAVKSQEDILQRSRLKTLKRVLTEGRKLAIEKIVNQVKDKNGKTAYKKIDFYYKNKPAIISLVKKNNHRNKPVIKSRKIQEQKKPLPKSRTKTMHKTWDVFICHATEDKKNVATPLAKKLKKDGIDVWYDEFELDWGSRLMESINYGLKNSLFGIVIMSNAFFKKEWAQRELSGLHSLSIANKETKILPLLYKITHKELTNYSPLLSDIIYKRWDEGIENITRSVQRLVKKKKGAQR